MPSPSSLLKLPKDSSAEERDTAVNLGRGVEVLHPEYPTLSLERGLGRRSSKTGKKYATCQLNDFSSLVNKVGFEQQHRRNKFILQHVSNCKKRVILSDVFVSYHPSLTFCFVVI